MPGTKGKTKKELKENYDKEYKVFLKLYEEGILNQKQMSEKIGCSKAKIYRFVKQYKEEKNIITLKSSFAHFKNPSNKQEEEQKEAVRKVKMLEKKKKEKSLYLRIVSLLKEGYNKYTVSKILNINLNKLEEVLK